MKNYEGKLRGIAMALLLTGGTMLTTGASAASCTTISSTNLYKTFCSTDRVNYAVGKNLRVTAQAKVGSSVTALSAAHGSILLKRHIAILLSKTFVGSYSANYTIRTAGLHQVVTQTINPNRLKYSVSKATMF